MQPAWRDKTTYEALQEEITLDKKIRMGGECWNTQHMKQQ